MSRKCCACIRKAATTDAHVKLHVLAVGERAPRWVNEACNDYLERFPRHCPLNVRAVATPRRGKHPDINKLRQQEFQSMRARMPKAACVIALDERGRAVNTNQLARRLGQWMLEEQDVVFLVGGPDGLAPAALDAAREKWSLSALTLPHFLARIVIIEQLYRAHRMLDNHPYHRG